MKSVEYKAKNYPTFLSCKGREKNRFVDVIQVFTLDSANSRVSDTSVWGFMKYVTSSRAWNYRVRLGFSNPNTKHEANFTEMRADA